ncbi:hypothetical protein GCM10010971_05010 [Silvimonas amylolytica]|uniref:Type II secretion system protein L n=2 Tax=Silvimonas amylolytica TaxID=449663 RepID=A0ABQ2PI37_9NEIS|nr:hypothetical protein GCM10010971_05010 [Silvimonas amylolytica]
MISGAASLDTRLHWCGIDATGKLYSGQSSLSHLPAAPAVELVLLPAAYSWHVLELPKQSPQRLRALVPHALDDRMLGSQVRHFGIGDTSTGQTRVIACDKAWLQQWLDLFRAQGIVVRAAWALVDLLPAEDEWQRLDTEEGVLLARQDESVWFDAAAIADQWLADQPVKQARWPDVCGDKPRHGAINLLQGELTPSFSLPFDPKRFKRTAGILIALLVVMTVTSAWDWWQLRQQATALQRELRQTFAAAFPGTPIVDPVLQLQSQLQAAGVGQGTTATGTDFTAMLQRIDAVASGTQLKRLQFENGQLQMELASNDAPALQQKLAGAGFKVDSQPGSVNNTVLRIQGGQK